MDNVFSAILRTGIYSLGIILIIFLLRILFKKKVSKAVLCSLWIFAAIRLLIPVQLETDFALIPEVSPISIAESMQKSEEQQNNTDSVAVLEKNVADQGLKSEISVDASENKHYQNGHTVRNETDIQSVNTEIIEKNYFEDNDSIEYLNRIAEKENVKEDHVSNMFSILGYIWLSGVAVFILLLVRRYVKVKGKLKDSCLLTANDDVYASEAISSAFVFGVLNPRIYVSTSIGDNQLDYVIAHERAHIERRDYITKLLAYLILSVYWFVPWVWAAYILFGRDVELACDEKVVAEKDKEYRADYAQVLLDSTIRNHHKEVGLVSFGEEKIKDRIENVVNYKKKSLFISLAVIAVAGIGLAIFLFSRNSKANGQSDDNMIQIKLLEHASPETSCIILYRFDGETTTWRYVFDKEWEQKVIDEINDLKLSKAGEDELLKWTEPCYGISICDTEGWEIWLTYSDGLWLTKDGSLYHGKYDLEGCFAEAESVERTEEDSAVSGIRMPNAAILSKYNIKYCQKASSEVYTEKNGVSLKMVSIDGDIAILEYRNDSDEVFTYGEEYSLQKYIDDWYAIPMAKSNYGFNDILNILNPGKSRQIKCYLTMYGDLEDGHYRIVKGDMCAEFDIPFEKVDDKIDEKVDEKVISYRGIISGESFEKGAGYDIQIIKTGQSEWKTVFVHWNRGTTRQTLEKKIDFDIKPSLISVPVTEVDINRDGYMDFIIDYGILGKFKKGDCIIWNMSTLKYEFLDGYSELCNAVFDTRTGRIYDSKQEETGSKHIRNQYIIEGNKLEVVATLIGEYDRSSGVTRYTEMQKIDGEFVVVQDNLPESEVSFEGWTAFIS